MDEFDELFPIYYPATAKSELTTGCIHNKAVMCDDRNACRKCGWNPAVDAERRPKTRERLRKAGVL